VRRGPAIGMLSRMTKRRSPGSVRFITQMTLQLEDGRSLAAGPAVGGRAAHDASGSMRVLLHDYPRTEDVTHSPERLAEALSGLRTDGALFSYRARIFSDGDVRVLVLDYLH
jgi:hypothetical protein